MNKSDELRALSLLAEVFSDIGHLEEKADDYSAAEANYLKSITTFEKCSAADSISSRAIEQILSAYTGLIDVHVYFARFSEALSCSSRMLVLLEQLVKRKKLISPHSDQLFAELHCRIGDINVEFGKYSEALKSYDRALNCQPSERNDEKYEKVRFTCAVAKIRRGDLCRTLGRYEEAAELLMSATLEFEQALLKDPSDFHSAFSKGLAVSTLAQLNLDLGQLRRALEMFSEAIHFYDNALMSRPTDGKAMHNKSVSLISSSDVAAQLGLRSEAKSNSDEALLILRSIVRRGKKIGRSSAALANGIAQMANLMIRAGEVKQGFNALLEAISSAEHTLTERPEDVRLRNTLGVICREYADALLSTGDLVGATKYCKKALGQFSEVLKVAPEHIDAMSNSASTLRQLGDIYRKQDRTFYSLRYTMRAQRQFDALTSITSSNVAVLNNLSNCWRSFAEILASKGLGGKKRVLAAYDLALKFLDQGVSEGESFLCMYNQSSLLLSLAQVLAEWSGPEEAIGACHDSINLAKEVRARVPGHLDAARVEAMCLLFLGDQLRRLGKADEAMSNYLLASNAFRAILEDTPSDSVSRKHLFEVNERLRS